MSNREIVGGNSRHPELDAEFAQHLGKQLDTPRTPLGCAWNRNCYQGCLASLAHPWLTCLHASGVQSAARRAVRRLAPGGAQRHPGFKGAMRIARRQACEDPLADHPEFLELRRSVTPAVALCRSPRGLEMRQDFVLV